MEDDSAPRWLSRVQTGDNYGKQIHSKKTMSLTKLA